MYAIQYVNIVMMMFFELFLLWVPKWDSNQQLQSDRRWDALTIGCISMQDIFTAER